MAETGEAWIRSVAEAQGYSIEEVGNEDVLIFKDKICVVIEDKDWKDPVEIYQNSIYQIAINGVRHKLNKGQVVHYAWQVKKMPKNKYKFVVPIFVFSNLIGRRVQVFYHKQWGHVFVVNREYFPIWLKSIERVYLGETTTEETKYYLGGK